MLIFYLLVRMNEIPLTPNNNNYSRASAIAEHIPLIPLLLLSYSTCFFGLNTHGFYYTKQARDSIPSANPLETIRSRISEMGMAPRLQNKAHISSNSVG